MDRINVVAEYDAYVNSPSIKIKIPSVVVLKEYIKPIKSNAFTRFNLFLRDEFKCQYCGSIDELTFDHVLPRAQGGKTTWENVVAACSDCNLKKGSGEPNKDKVGSISIAQIEEIAKIKLPDLNTNDLSAASNMIKGTARSMGVTVKD